MDGVKLACGFAIVAVVAGSQLPRLVPEAGRPASTSGVVAASGAPRPRPLGPVPTSAGYQTTVIAPDAYGQFQTAVEIEGQSLPVLVDTGATYVVLTYEDAERLGFRPMPADFKYRSSTANGSAAVARVEIPEIRLGPISVRNVTAFVGGRGSLWKSLLGMSFLSRLGDLHVDAGRLVLRQ